MLNRHTPIAVTTALSLSLLMSAVALAQARPTLSEAEMRIDALESEVANLEAALGVADAEALRNRAAVCAAADAQGQSYRPFVCEPRCDCFDASELEIADPDVSSECLEEASGEFVLRTTNDLGSCTADVCLSNGCASSSGLAPCPSGGCPGDEVCVSGGFGFTSCRLPCDVDADCNGSSVCSGSAFTPCSSNADCGLDEACGTSSSGGACYRSCKFQSCSVVRTAQLSGVGEPDAPTAVTCVPPSATESVINANDAIECLVQFEAAAGIACSYLCGDGGLDPGEQCDDGNTTPGDGCDSSCQLES